MKRKIFLLALIIITSFLAWRLFVENFSQEPIEIIPRNLEQTSKQTPEQTSDKILDKQSVDETKQNLTSQTNDKKIKAPANSSANENDDIPAPTKNTFIINKKVSWGYTISNNRTTDTIVIHSSYDALGPEPYDLEGLISEYQQYGVAPHYLIDREGKIYQLVEDKNIAYHAGVSKMPDGRTGVNNFSIGIEMMNTKEDDYTSKQYSSLNDLIDFLENQHSTKYVLGHQDISPNRKTDPWNIEWDKIESEHSIR